MIEKFILSICYVEHCNNEIFSEPYGLFDTFESAQRFAILAIEQLEFDFGKKDDSGKSHNIDDYYSFDYTIKKIHI